jgi:hypothetical protein
MAFHGIAGVGRQVDHDRFELVGVGLDREGPFRNVQRECNAGPEHRAKHLGDALQLTGDVEDFPVHGVTAREDQQLAGQLGRAVGRIRNCIDISPPTLRRKLTPPKKIG